MFSNNNPIISGHLPVIGKIIFKTRKLLMMK